MILKIAPRESRTSKNAGSLDYFDPEVQAPDKRKRVTKKPTVPVYDPKNLGRAKSNPDNGTAARSASEVPRTNRSGVVQGSSRRQAVTAEPVDLTSLNPTLPNSISFDLQRIVFGNRIPNITMSTTQNDQNAQGANEAPVDILKLLGPPALSPEEQGEYNNAKFPATHKTAMILDLADPIQMPEWMRFCLTTFQATGVASEKVKMQRIFGWMTLQTKQALEHLPGAEEGSPRSRAGTQFPHS